MNRNIKIDIREDKSIDGISFDVTSDEIEKLWLNGSLNNKIRGWDYNLALINVKQIIREKFFDPAMGRFRNTQELFPVPREVFIDSSYTFEKLEDDEFVTAILIGTDKSMKRVDASSKENESKFDLMNSKVFHKEKDQTFKMGLIGRHDVEYMTKLLEYLTYRSKKICYIGKIEAEYFSDKEKTVFVNLVSYTDVEDDVFKVVYKVELETPKFETIGSDEYKKIAKELIQATFCIEGVCSEICELL